MTLEDAEWTQRLRYHLKRELVAVVVEVAGLLHTGRFSSRSLRMVNRLLAIAPLAEDGYRSLVRIYRDQGNWPQAWNALSRWQAAFARALGVEAAPDLEIEHARLRLCWPGARWVG